jgi:hypothetical protein
MSYSVVVVLATVVTLSSSLQFGQYYDTDPETRLALQAQEAQVIEGRKYIFAAAHPAQLPQLDLTDSESIGETENTTRCFTNPIETKFHEIP